MTDLPPIEGETRFNNRDLEDDQFETWVVGCVPRIEFKPEYNGLWSKPAGLNGLHVCNSQWLATGEPWPVTLPDTQFDPFWIPLCCKAADERIAGGSESGGAVVHAFGFSSATAGGSESGGRVVHAFGFTSATAGGSESGGAVVHAFGFSSATAGGSESGGAVVHVYTVTNATAGGSESGGAVVHAFGFSSATAGGSESGGAVVHAFGFSSATAGGSESGGAVVHAFGFTSATAGGSESGGAVVHAFGFSSATAGGSESGGAVTHTYNPGTVTPGTTCSGAGSIGMGVTYTGPIPAFFSADWFKFTVPSTGQMHVSTTGLSGMGFALTVMEGGSCPSPSIVTLTTTGPPKWIWNATVGDQCWVRVDGFGASGTYTLTVNTGP